MFNCSPRVNVATHARQASQVSHASHDDHDQRAGPAMPCWRGALPGLVQQPCLPRQAWPAPGAAQNQRVYAILLEIPENQYRKLQYLVLGAFKTHHKTATFSDQCSKHTIKWQVEKVNFNPSRLKS